MDAFSPDVVFLDAILASVSATGVVARSRLASSLELSGLQMAKSLLFGAISPVPKTPHECPVRSGTFRDPSIHPKKSTILIGNGIPNLRKPPVVSKPQKVLDNM